ncbi:hypothetical protein [Streptomyces diastaticus]|uniref:hypothetical protein n=1 Tax=Streptomyces diastaticus TaxID=1956 RepID=UPI00369ADE26
MTLIDPYGVDQLQPVQDPCPACWCCSAALCGRGCVSVLECAGSTHPDLRSLVTGCPCSAASTEGTAAWRAAMMTATLQATELPLPEPGEAVLRAIARGEDEVDDPYEFVLALRLRQFVQTAGGMLRLTGAGRAYLDARDGRRGPVRARVAAVDLDERTARIELDGYPGVVATVLLDVLETATGLEPGEAVGLELVVTAPVDPTAVAEVVLTGLRVVSVPPLPLPGTAAFLLCDGGGHG